MSKKSSEHRCTGKVLTLERVKQLARKIYEKKGADILVFDLRELSPIADFFVIASGLSTIHNRTIAEFLVESEKPSHLEGYEAGNWVLLDYFDIIVHIFLKETRVFYGLERLWGDAPQVKVDDD
jgi:ribosome-associated protein